MLELISLTEYEQMAKYRDWYAFDNLKSEATIASIEHVLEEWNEKKQDLFKLLGNNLIIKKDIHYEKDASELEDDFNHILWGNLDKVFKTRLEYDPLKFKRQFIDWIDTTFPKLEEPLWIKTTGYYYCTSKYTPTKEEEKEYKEYEEKSHARTRIVSTLRALTAPGTLATNKVVNYGDPITIPLKNGKKYVITDGSKPLRVLGKIANSYGLDGFEEFRIVHSLVHNTKSLSGKLVLSIHPLDFWTMSDNSCDWDSCMSWINTGGFRRGTVEMMNSPYVVEAYLESKEPFEINNEPWSNKKWRMLFIVSENIICGVKDYPYRNAILQDIVMEWLQQLAKNNMDWNYDTKNIIRWNGHDVVDIGLSSYNLKLYTNDMYNDINCAKDHPLLMNKEDITLNYSGLASCLCCGTVGNNYDCEDMLTCTNCSNIRRCWICGEILYEDDNIYETNDGCLLCECCWEDSSIICSYCGENFYDNDVEMFDIILPIPPEAIQQQICRETNPSLPDGAQWYVQLAPDIEVCPDCNKAIFEKYTVPSTNYYYYDGKITGERQCNVIDITTLNEKEVEEINEILAFYNIDPWNCQEPNKNNYINTIDMYKLERKN